MDNNQRIKELTVELINRKEEKKRDNKAHNEAIKELEEQIKDLAIQ